MGESDSGDSGRGKPAAGAIRVGLFFAVRRWGLVETAEQLRATSNPILPKPNPCLDFRQEAVDVIWWSFFGSNNGVPAATVIQRKYFVSWIPV
jgi:hypothetical protein